MTARGSGQERKLRPTPNAAEPGNLGSIPALASFHLDANRFDVRSCNHYCAGKEVRCLPMLSWVCPKVYMIEYMYGVYFRLKPPDVFVFIIRVSTSALTEVACASFIDSLFIDFRDSSREFINNVI